MVLVLSLAAMAAAAMLAPLVAKVLGRNTGYVLSVVFLGAGAAIATQLPAVFDGETVEERWAWLPTLGVEFHLRLDGIAALFAALILGVGALITAYAARYLKDDGTHARLFLFLALFATSMLGLVLAGDVILLFVCWELTTLSSFFLIAGNGLAGAKPATRALVTTGTGGLGLLAAAVMIAAAAGTTDLSIILANPQVVTDSPLAPAIMITILLAAFTKSAQVPFHFWLPDAMVAITPVSAYLHAATLVKGGIYLLLRFTPVFSGQTAWHVVLLAVGLVSAIVGALFALQRHDLKALLAYSTVSQLGFLIALIGVGTPEALAAAALHTFAHALFKATLFMLVGIIDREAGSRDIRDLSGLWRVMPVTATLTGLAAASMAGIPPFLGFVSKEEAFYAFLDTPGPSWAGPLAITAAIAAAALTFAYGFRMVHGAFGGATIQGALYEPRALFLAPAAVPAVLGLGLGLTPAMLDPLIGRTVLDTYGPGKHVELLLWHGFTAALLASALTITIGAALFALRRPVDRGLERLRLPLTGAEGFDGLYDGAVRTGELVGAPAMRSGLASHLARPVLGLLALGAVGVAVIGPLPDPPGPVTRASDWVIVALLAVSVLGAAVVRNRLAAISMVGVAGFLVAGWFLFAGAPDLALTQMLVEILTVVVAVLVLRRLPRRFRAARPGRTAGSALIALASGVVAFLATFALTGRREISAAGGTLVRDAYDLSGGTNVVNTVLVDFRGLDTLGEVGVLAIAAIGLLALLRRDRPQPAQPAEPGLADVGTTGNNLILVVAGRVVTPVVVALTAYLLLRGHYQPGGGFIAALVAGGGVAVAQLPRMASTPLRLRASGLVRVGVVTMVVSGVLGLTAGSFLRPLTTDVAVGGLSTSLSSSLIFDLGVLLAVVGLVVAGLDRLARGVVEHGGNRDAHPVGVRR